MEKQFLAEGTNKKAYKIGENFIETESKGSIIKEEALSQMHLATIAHILFPQNIPTPIAIKQDELTRKYNLVFEYIDHSNDSEHTRLTLDRNEGSGAFSEEDYIANEKIYFTKVRQDQNFIHLRGKLLSAGFYSYEIEPYNVIKDRDGNFIFIDFEPAFWSHSVSLNEKSFFNFDIAKLVDYVDKNTSGVTKELARKELKSILMLLPDDYQKHFLEKYNL